MDIVTGLDNRRAVLSEDWNEKAYQASLHFCILERDVNSPMSDASLARLFFRHIPEALELDRIGEESSACQARFLSRRIEQDMVVGRDYDQWLAGYNHLKPETREMFARGKANSLNPILDRLADIGGFEREDILVREAREDARKIVKEHVISEEQRKRLNLEKVSAMRSFGMNDNGL